MTVKELFLKIETYEEFDKRRDEFKELEMDKDILEHMSKIFPKASDTKEELYSYRSDGSLMLGGKGGTKKPK